MPKKAHKEPAPPKVGKTHFGIGRDTNCGLAKRAGDAAIITADVEKVTCQFCTGKLKEEPVAPAALAAVAGQVEVADSIARFYAVNQLPISGEGASQEELKLSKEEIRTLFLKEGWRLRQASAHHFMEAQNAIDALAKVFGTTWEEVAKKEGGAA